MSQLTSYIIEPAKFAQSMILSSNLTNAQPDWISGSYALDAEVLWDVAPTSGLSSGINMRRVFRSLEAANTAFPVGSSKWQDVGPANTVAMFTNKNSEVSSRVSGIDITIVAQTYIDAVALFGLGGNQVSIEIRSPGGVLRSSQTKEIRNRPGATDWLSFFFAAPEQIEQILFMPAVALPGDHIRLRISGAAKCSRFFFGQTTEIGLSPQWGATWSMDNYTSADPDEFGYVDPTVRDYAPRNQVSIFVNKSRSNALLKMLTNLRGTPVVFVGTTNPQFTNALVNYGLIRDPTYTLSNFGHHMLDFELKGFI